MTTSTSARQASSRRAFLQFLARSPLFAGAGMLAGPLSKLLAQPFESPARASSLLDALAQDAEPITRPEDALGVMDFEASARKALPVAHFGYLATGVDDDATLRANLDSFTRYGIRSRRLTDVRTIDTSVRLFGSAWETPIVLAPVGSIGAFHSGAETAVARAARSRGHLQILSSATTTSVEDVVAARGAPVWYQLYVNENWEIARGMLRRAESAGCPVVALTVDLQDDSNRETLFRAQRRDSRQCSTCHEPGMAGYFRRKSMYQGFDVTKVPKLVYPGSTWELVKRIKDTTKMKLVLKGIVTREDTQLALENGVDGIIVSNHGGRSEETLRATMDCLPEVLGAANRRIPVLIDGGFRRGTDVFKALALGASAICIGRPYLWGLASFGQPGVEAVLAILRRELETIMRQAGTVAVNSITDAYLSQRGR